MVGLTITLLMWGLTNRLVLTLVEINYYRGDINMNTLEINKKPWEILFSIIQEKNYGDFLDHKEISAIINEPYGSSKYKTILDKVKREALADGKAIESVRGLGYKITEPGDYSYKSARKVVQGTNRIKEAKHILDCTPIDKLSETELNIHRNVNDRVSIVYAHMMGAKTEINLLAKKNHPLQITG